MTDNPRNALEIALVRGRENLLNMQTILWVFAASTIYVPSGTEPGENMTNFSAGSFRTRGHPDGGLLFRT